MITRFLFALSLLLSLAGAPALAVAAGAGQVCNGSNSDCTDASAPYCVFDGFSSTCQANASTQSGGGNTGTTLVNPLNAGTSLESFLGGILDFIIRIGSIVVILMLVFVGYKFVAARGNSSELEGAKQMLLYTLVGALILLGAKAIAIGICETTNAVSTGGTVISCVF